MTASSPRLDRRRFLAAAGSGVAVASAASALAATPALAATGTTTTDPPGGATIVTVTGTVPGIPFRTGTAQLDVAEYARRAAINSSAFDAAWRRALDALRIVPTPADSPASGHSVNWLPNAGVVLRVPPGYYAIDQWNLAVRAADLHLPGSEREAHQQFGEWSVRVTIEADGVALVAKDYEGSTFAGAPVVYLGSPDSPGYGHDLLKRVVIRGLSIQSDANPIQAFTVSNRSGLAVEHAQEIRLERISVFGFAHEGVRLVGVMDSSIEGVVIGWCARAARSGSSAYALSLLTTRDAAGTPTDNCNAIRVIDSHVEFCDHELLIDRGSRHIDVIGSKFEHGWGTTSVASPISIGYPPDTGSALERAREISFTSCMFVQNTYAHPGAHPSHIVVGESQYGGGEAASAKTAVTFAACHFSTPDGIGERWFTGGDTTFLACDFGGCATTEGEPACFDLANDVILDDCRFSLVREVHDGLTGDAEDGGAGAVVNGSRVDLFRFRGGASRVLGPVIYCPPPVSAHAGAPGTIATIAAGAGDANRLSGWHPAWYGIPSGVDGGASNIALVRYEDTGRTQLGTSLVVDPLAQSSSPVLHPDEAGRVSVCGWEQVRVAGGRTYTGFTDGYAGQIIRVIADGAPVTFIPGSLVLRTAGPLIAGPSVMTSFVFYSHSSDMAWFQI